MPEPAVHQISIVVSEHQDRQGTYLRLTTWGVHQGTYGSLGSVRVRAGFIPGPAELDRLARLVLTALYGIDYDL